jgi:hypothetical protein
MESPPCFCCLKAIDREELRLLLNSQHSAAEAAANNHNVEHGVTQGKPLHYRQRDLVLGAPSSR